MVTGGRRYDLRGYGCIFTYCRYNVYKSVCELYIHMSDQAVTRFLGWGGALHKVLHPPSPPIQADVVKLA